jgi:hypothetical protein
VSVCVVRAIFLWFCFTFVSVHLFVRSPFCVPACYSTRKSLGPKSDHLLPFIDMSQREYRKPRNFNKEESGAHERDDFNQIGDDRAVNVSVSCHNDTRIEVTGYLYQKRRQI